MMRQPSNPGQPVPVQLSFDDKWAIVIACDASYDGQFVTAVKTTGIYCRPSCRSRKPKKVNVAFMETNEQAEQAGYRACKRCQPEVERAPQEELASRIIGFLTEHHKRKLALQDLADYIGMSAYYLERQFKQTTSLTPRAYLEKLRIGKACALLADTELTHLEICYEVGFRSPSSFYKAFSRHMLCAPGEYRERRRRLGPERSAENG
nr:MULTISPECIES: Ada metal-binding domain-containing protein [unclassified Paenibacillus]